jgi:serine protease Do
LIILGVFVLGPVAFQTPDAQAYNGILPQNISELAETARPGVVNIRTVRTVKQRGRVLRPFPSPFGENDPFKDFFAPFFGEEMPHEFKQQSLGSGFVIDREAILSPIIMSSMMPIKSRSVCPTKRNSMPK